MAKSVLEHRFEAWYSTTPMAKEEGSTPLLRQAMKDLMKEAFIAGSDLALNPERSPFS